MPTQTGTQSQVARKVNFAIQLLHEAAELLETSPRSTRSTFTAKRPRYTRRTSAEREDYTVVILARYLEPRADLIVCERQSALLERG